MTIVRTLATAGLVCAVGSSGFAMGRVVVCGDEWPLNNSAFTTLNPTFTAIYATNVANFMVGASGSFLNTTNIPTVGSQLGAKLTSLGYSYTLDSSSAITPALLAPYNGVFFGGTRGRADIAANLTTLTNYVSGGGSVYIFGGTGFFSSSAAEAAGWNPFTTQYGITLGPSFILPAAAQNVTTDPGGHPLRIGVTKLSYGYGHDVTVTGSAVVALSGGPELSANIGMVATTAVPEPCSMAALGLGSLALLRRRSTRIRLFTVRK